MIQLQVQNESIISQRRSDRNVAASSIDRADISFASFLWNQKIRCEHFPSCKFIIEIGSVNLLPVSVKPVTNGGNKDIYGHRGIV
jgi:hypothetical protein